MSDWRHDGEDQAAGDRSRRGAPVPANIGAEQALLGALLYDNAGVASVEGLVLVEAFHEPFHGEMFRVIVDRVSKSQLADAITLDAEFSAWPAYEQLGGLRYLADLVDRAPPTVNAPDYARAIREAWQRREVAKLGNEVADVARKRTDIEVSDIIEELEKRLLKIQTSTRAATLVSAESAVDRTMNELEDPSSSHGVELGLPPLDTAIGGLHPGELWLVAARPSMGKSALASCASLHVARNGVHPNGQRLGVIEINGEMTVEQMTRRHLTDWAFDLSPRDAPSYAKIRKRTLSHEEHVLIRHVSSLLRPLTTLKMVKRTGMTLTTLRGLIRRQVAAWDREGIRLGLVTIDHVGLLRPDRETRGRYEAQTDIAIELKELADELQIPMLALVQLSRQLESRDDKHPTLPDLRDSGAWEENADGVIGVYRDAYYAQREPSPKKSDLRQEWEMRKESQTVEAILLKIREGASGTVELWGDMPRNAIRGSRPDSLYGAAGWLPLEPAPPAASSLSAPSNEAAKMNTAAAFAPAGQPSEDIGQLADGRPEPPLEAYDLDEFT